MDESGKCWKIVKTLWLFWAFTMPGISDAVLGPTLLDLEVLVSEGTENFSFIILGTGIGTVVGSLVASLFSSYDVHLRLGVTLLFGSVVNVVLPQVASYAYLLVMFTLQGFAKGIIVVYMIELCNSLWEKKGVPFQFILCGSMTGAVIAPLLTQPFLCNKKHVHEDLSLNGLISHSNSSLRSVTNSSHPAYTGSNSTENRSSSSIASSSNVCTAEDSRVQLAYVLLGCITLPCAVAFAYYWIRNRNGGHQNPVSPPYKTLESSTEIVQKRLYYTFLVFLFFYFLPVIGNLILYGTFLTAFGVYGPLRVSKDSMVMMTSLLFASCLIGRIFNTMITPCCGTLKIIVVNSLALLVIGVLLITVGQQFKVVLWICTAAFGFFSSPLAGAGFAWTAEQISLNPSVLSYCVFSFSVGNMILPFLGGIVFHRYGPTSYFYLVVFMVVLQILVFVVLFLLARRLKQTESAFVVEREIVVESEN